MNMYINIIVVWCGVVCTVLCILSRIVYFSLGQRRVQAPEKDQGGGRRGQPRASRIALRLRGGGVAEGGEQVA